MIKKILFLVAILTLSLFAYNVFYNVIEVKINAQNELLEKIPIIVISENDTLLYKISSEIDSLNFIEKITYTMADTLRKNLIKRYKLENAKRYLNNSYLPNIMKIFLKKGQFNSESKTLIANILKKYKNEISIRYNDELWREINVRTDFLKSFFSNLSYTYWGIITLLLFFLHYLFEMLENSYWKIFLKSGGHISYWLKKRVLQAFLIAILSVIISYSMFIPLKVLSPYFNLPDKILVLYEFVGILCVNLLSVLILRRKYD